MGPKPYLIQEEERKLVDLCKNGVWKNQTGCFADTNSTRQADDNGGLEVDDCSSTDIVNDSTHDFPIADVSNVSTEVDNHPVVDTGNDGTENNDCHSAETDCGSSTGNVDSSSTEKEGNVYVRSNRW